MNSLSKVIIFGATSGIAKHAARQLVCEGASVHCVARNQEKLDSLLADLRIRANDSQIISGSLHDLDDISQHATIWQQAKDSLGGCDGVLMAQGVLPNQTECQQSAEKTLASLHTNAISIINLLTLAANDFEAQKNGAIAVISSVAGDRGRQSNYIYGAAKGLLSIFLQGLRNRLFKSRVSVTTVKPGFTRTQMTAEMNREGFLWADADVVGKGIVQAMRQGKDEIYLKPIWRIIMMLIKAIPETIFKRLSL